MNFSLKVYADWNLQSVNGVEGNGLPVVLVTTLLMMNASEYQLEKAVGCRVLNAMLNMLQANGCQIHFYGLVGDVLGLICTEVL